jgi:magnesium transporter
MPRYVRKRSKKIGLLPGALVHIGVKKTDKVRITVFDYDELHFEEREVATVEECFPYRDSDRVTWIDIDGIHQVELIEKIGTHFNLHPLVLEDILTTGQRPKVENFGEYLYVVLEMLSYDEKGKGVKGEQVSMVIGSKFVISFQEREEDVFNHIRERIRTAKGLIRKMNADYLAYTLIDAIVDNYYIVLEKLGEEIEGLEGVVVDNPSPGVLRQIHRLKGEMIFLRRAVWPLREVINGLERGESTLIRESTKVFLRDIYDHTIQIIDTVEISRDIIAGMVDTYLSSVSNRMNEVMKVLTIIATIFIPLTFIAGIYGMNFKYMPELEWRWGYFLLLAVMVALGAAMVLYFRSKKWL